MLINVILGGKTVWEDGIPRAVGGYPAVMDTDELEKKEHEKDDARERTKATEYWLDGELVHRSVDMHLKTGLFCIGKAAKLQGA